MLKPVHGAMGSEYGSDDEGPGAEGLNKKLDQETKIPKAGDRPPMENLHQHNQWQALKEPAMLSVGWRNCGDDGHWCDLEKLDLVMKTTGVYIIWHEGNPSKVVRIGQGKIAERLAAHRNDPEITAYSKFGPLLVTWAAVSAAQRDGVERYLADRLNPLVGDEIPYVEPIAVNNPW